MINFNKVAIQLYLKFFASPEQKGQIADGISTVLDGNTAIAVAEACTCEVAVLGSSFSQQASALSWISEQQRVISNLFDQKLQIQHADSPRGALATAMGVCLSGHRSTVFLDAQDMASCQDLLYLAVGKKLPLVIHLTNQLLGKQGNNSGCGHEVLHQIKDTGCIVLVASNVQEVVDFTLIARHIAEISLSPVVVVMDGMETANSIQDVRLPSRELLRQFIGQADEKIETPTVAQKQLFSETRHRLHRWHDLDQPSLQGAMITPELSALGSSAQSVYFNSHIQQQMSQAYSSFATLTGRKYSSLSSHRLKKSDIIFIALGSTVETVKTLANLSAQTTLLETPLEKMNIGVLGISSLRPFDSEQLLASIEKCKHIVVLDRSDTALADDAPLMREIQSILYKNQKQKQKQKEIQSQIKASVHSIIYGLDGAELCLSDLIDLSAQIKSLGVSNKQLDPRYLGIQFNRDMNTSDKPKQQAMLDVLSRYYPNINSLGLSSNSNVSYLKTDNKPLSLAINHCGDHSYTSDISHFLYKLLDNPIRSLIGASTQNFRSQWNKRQTDYILQSENSYVVNSSTAVDYYIVVDADANSLLSACKQLNKNGVLYFSSDEEFDQPYLSKSLTDSLSGSLELIKSKKLKLVQVSKSTTSLIDWEKLIGLLTADLKVDFNLILKVRKILSIRQASLVEYTKNVLNHNSEDKIEFFKQAMEEPQLFDKTALLSAKSETLVTGSPFSSDADGSFSKDADGSLVKSKMSENFAQESESYNSLTRFLDQSDLETSDLCADPFLASAIMPPLTASFNDLSRINLQSIPQFNPIECTACGDCWENCPDSAIATVALSPQALMDTAINNVGADALRSVSAKMASRIAKQLRNDSSSNSGKAGELLSDAMDWLKEKSGLPEDRLTSIEADYDKALPSIADLPIVVTDVFFNDPEKHENGSGELFSLVINPQSCKSCGLCTQMCQTDALAFVAENIDAVKTEVKVEDTVEQTRSQVNPKKLWAMWQQTPDTLSSTIVRLKKDNLLSTGAALMLSRYHAFALSGGDLSEAGSGEKIALRQILSGVEYFQQPLLSRFIVELEQLRNNVKDEININLAQALPTDNLDQLALKLSDIKTRQVDLNDLLDSSSQLMESSAIDAPKIRELVDYVLQLNELLYNLSTGTYGLGRSRYSLCITSASISSWAGSYPNNPFHVPVHIDMTGESAQIATGLVQGQMSDILSAISLKRRVESSLGLSKAKNKKLDLLDWSDLSRDEQKLCPPLLLVGGDDLLSGQGLAQISLLLNSHYPIKIVVFSQLDSGVVDRTQNSSHSIDTKNNLALMAMSQRNAYVAQSSLADSTHLQKCVHEMLDSKSASILRIYTPSPSLHGFSPEQTVQQAQLAIKTRLSPLFSYNPDLEGVFGSCLSLEGNNDAIADWVSIIEIDNEAEDKTLNKTINKNRLTPIDWAINEKRFQSHFTSLTDSKEMAPFPIELLEWIKLSKTDQQKKTPIYTIGSDKIAVSKEFALMVAETQQLWQTLQELAGLVTPFTKQVEITVAGRLADEHQQELDNLRSEYETKLKELEENYNSQTHTKIRNQLLGLAGYDASNLH